jgi:hypothetical protein
MGRTLCCAAVTCQANARGSVGKQIPEKSIERRVTRDDALRDQFSSQCSANSGRKQAEDDKRAKCAEQCVETEIGSAFHGVSFSLTLNAIVRTFTVIRLMKLKLTDPGFRIHPVLQAALPFQCSVSCSGRWESIVTGENDERNKIQNLGPVWLRIEGAADSEAILFATCNISIYPI